MNDIYKTIPLLLFINSLTAFCPDKCSCDDNTLETTCIETKLEVTICIHNLYIYFLFISGDADDSKPEHENIDLKVQQLSLSGCKF